MKNPPLRPVALFLSILLASGTSADAVEESVKVIGFRRRVMVFGHSAPRRPNDPRRPEQGDKPWVIDDEDKTQLDVIDLEGHQPGVVPSSRLGRPPYGCPPGSKCPRPICVRENRSVR